MSFSENDENLPWLTPEETQWDEDVLDLRSITQTAIATSSSSEIAANALSFKGENGLVFWG